MADQENDGETGSKGGGLSGFKAILTKKVGVFPVWVLGLLGILIVAYILKRRAASTAAVSPTASSNAGSLTSQTFPYANPMNYSNDVYVNNPQTTPTTPTTTPSAPGNTVTVLPGWHVDQWLKDINNQGYNISYADLVAANPGLVANIDWNPTDRINFFKSGAQYNVPPQDMPKKATAS